MPENTAETKKLSEQTTVKKKKYIFCSIIYGKEPAFVGIGVDDSFIDNCRYLNQFDIYLTLKLLHLAQHDKISLLHAKEVPRYLTNVKNGADTLKKFVAKVKFNKNYDRINYKYGIVEFYVKIPEHWPYIFNEFFVDNFPKRGMSLKLYLLLLQLYNKCQLEKKGDETSGNHYVINLSKDDVDFLFPKPDNKDYTMNNRYALLKNAIQVVNSVTDMCVASKRIGETWQIRIAKKTYDSWARNPEDGSDDSESIFDKYKFDLSAMQKKVIVRATSNELELRDLLKTAKKEVKMLLKNKLLEPSEIGNFIVKRAITYQHRDEDIIKWYMQKEAQVCVLKVYETTDDLDLLYDIYCFAKSLAQLQRDLKSLEVDESLKHL